MEVKSPGGHVACRLPLGSAVIFMPQRPNTQYADRGWEAAISCSASVDCQSLTGQPTFGFQAAERVIVIRAWPSSSCL